MKANERGRAEAEADVGVRVGVGGKFKDTGFIELSNGLRNGQSKHQNSLAIGQGQHPNNNTTDCFPAELGFCFESERP